MSWRVEVEAAGFGPFTLARTLHRARTELGAKRLALQAARECPAVRRLRLYNGRRPVASRSWWERRWTP